MGCIMSKFNKNNSIEDELYKKYRLKMKRKEFEILCEKVKDGKELEVLAAVDQNRRLATRYDFNSGCTLLHKVCLGYHDSPNFVQGLLERGANIHALTKICPQNNIIFYDALMCASIRGHKKIIKVLLDYGANPNFNSSSTCALCLAASHNYLEVCLLLISRGANLMQRFHFGTALNIYGDAIKYSSRITWGMVNHSRATMLTAFERGPFKCWTRRWPMMSVMAGCGFRPLAERLLEQEMHLAAIVASGTTTPPPAPIALDTPQQRRAFYMQIIFRCDGLLRRIVSFL